MKNLSNYAEKPGKRIIIIFVLIDLKGEIKEDVVFVIKAKTHEQNAFWKRKLVD